VMSTFEFVRRKGEARRFHEAMQLLEQWYEHWQNGETVDDVMLAEKTRQALKEAE